MTLLTWWEIRIKEAPCVTLKTWQKKDTKRNKSGYHKQHGLQCLKLQEIFAISNQTFLESSLMYKWRIESTITTNFSSSTVRWRQYQQMCGYKTNIERWYFKQLRSKSNTSNIIPLNLPLWPRTKNYIQARQAACVSPSL